MDQPQVKSFDEPDEVRTFPKGKVEIVRLDAGSVQRTTYEPGWRWSEHLKPIAGTDCCEVDHFNYLVSGTMVVMMNDGTEVELKAGGISRIPSGHVGWVVGDEPVVIIGFGEDSYGKGS